MKIGLIGYGKMGKTIAEMALERGHEIVATLNRSSTDIDWNNLNDADVCIDFTRPESALKNFEYCFKNNHALVTGTTGWYDHMDRVKAMCTESKGTFFWASNFSIGVNLFWQMNKRLAELMAEHPDYHVSMTEIHHTQKLDEPSGTAITTANQIIQRSPLLDQWKLTSDKLSETDLPIEALREGDVKGTHIVTYESEIDRIQLSHEAKSRAGFALGAILAAEFLSGKTGWFEMDDLLQTNS